MSRRKDVVEFRTESVLSLDSASFEKKIHHKMPCAAQFPSFRWKGNYGDWGERSDIVILQQSSIYILQVYL